MIHIEVATHLNEQLEVFGINSAMTEGKLSFSFGAQPGGNGGAKASAPSNLELLMAKAKAAPAAKKPPVLFDDDDETKARPAPNMASNKTSGPKPVSQMSRAERKAREEALKIDQSVFDYDGVYDQLKSAERKAEQARKATASDNKPKYMESFIAAAQTRKLDRLRAEEKLLERERLNEGDEFADKEKFVTEAYKRQMEEVRKAEEEEKAREGKCCDGSLLTAAAARKGHKGPGLTSLYKSMLDDNDAKHDAAMAATTASSAGPSLAIRPPTQIDEEEYDPLLAREAGQSSSGRAGLRDKAKYSAGARTVNDATGKEIEVNDDGEIVDKRSLLRAGLNITKKPGPSLPASLLSGSGQRSEAGANQPYVSRAVGAAASYQERRAREQKRLVEQMKEQEEKKRRDAAERAREEEEAARRRREGDDGEAEQRRLGAKERYLARKRQKDEEAEAKKKAKVG